MAWGTDFIAKLFLSRKVYSTIYQEKDGLVDCEGEITECEAKIKMFAAANIRDLSDQVEGDLISFIHSDIQSLLDDLRDLHITHFQLSCYIEYLEGTHKTKLRPRIIVTIPRWLVWKRKKKQ